MSKTDSDIRRKLLGVIFKPIVKDEHEDDEQGITPEGGCNYYGNTDAMKHYCPSCTEKNCY